MYKFLLVPLASLALFAQEPITPISDNIIYNKAKAELGKKLFFDKELSKDGKLSCASCHHLPGNGADKKRFSRGSDNKTIHINTPTVLNSANNGSFFFEGKTTDIKKQVEISIESPLELDTTVGSILNRLKQSKQYKEAFDTVYTRQDEKQESVTKEHLLDAIAEFEKALSTPNSKFDKYLRGDTKIFTKEEATGYKKFISMGCVNCHNGVNIGGNMYQKMGIFTPYTQDQTLNGRIDITNRKRDKYVYKVPSLRNIAITAPYMHDGQIRTLKNAIKSMREHQLGVTNNSKSIRQIEAFLRTLTGETPAILKGER